jgi:hypothetical protein
LIQAALKEISHEYQLGSQIAGLSMHRRLFAAQGFIFPRTSPEYDSSHTFLPRAMFDP